MAEKTATKKTTKRKSKADDEGSLLVVTDGNLVSADSLGGETRISQSVIATIAGVAAREVPGVYQLGRGALSQAVGRVTGKSETTLGVNAEVGKKEVAIDMVMIIDYDYNISEVTSQVRQLVARRIEHMTKLVVKEVNIDVVGINYGPKEKEALPKARVE